MAVIVLTAIVQVRLNAWNQPFYDAIQRKDMGGFTRQLGVFFVIAGILLVLNVAQTLFNQLIRVSSGRISGLSASARAIATRHGWPPDNWSG